MLKIDYFRDRVDFLSRVKRATPTRLEETRRELISRRTIDYIYILPSFAFLNRDKSQNGSDRSSRSDTRLSKLSFSSPTATPFLQYLQTLLNGCLLLSCRSSIVDRINRIVVRETEKIWSAIASNIAVSKWKIKRFSNIPARSITIYDNEKQKR